MTFERKGDQAFPSETALKSPLDPILRRLGTSFGAHAIVPARNKCGHLRQASSYPLDDVAVPEKSNSEHLMRATGSSLGGPASGPSFYTIASRGRRRLRRIVCYDDPV